MEIKMRDIFHNFTVIITTGVLLNLTLREIVVALPASTAAPANAHHIVSYINQRQIKPKHDEFPDFDFENINTSQPRTPIQQLFGRLVDRLDMNLDNSMRRSGGGMSLLKGNYSTMRNIKRTDDLIDSRQNTLDDINDAFGSREHHESMSSIIMGANVANNGVWNRMKQSIPVLESVRHLVNTVRDGSFNHTAHFGRQQHQMMHKNNSGGGDAMSMGPNQNESSAIETEEEREQANDSPQLKILDLLGTIGGMIWSFITNLKQVFAASGANASGASSSSSFGGN